MDAAATLTPRRCYTRDLQRRGFAPDPAQEKLVAALDELYAHLTTARRTPWRRVWQRLRNDASRPRGLYIWGEVGRGKTWLMDRFYECLPFPEKQRLHFHHFMRAVHAELKTLRDHEDPLALVAARWAASTRVICFDEFAVSDIADATILGRLLQQLFMRHVTLVATSNVAPDDLYRNGLKRELFLPAIALLKTHLRVMHCDGGHDYRLRQLRQVRLYHTPLDAAATAALEESFASIAGVDGTPQNLQIEGREIPARRVADGVAWFDFDVICGGPRAAADYIEIARLFHTVIVSGIPALNDDSNDEARRLIALVDEFYDRGVKLIVSAAVSLDQLYRGERLAMEFKRTASRLVEMQSEEYLARAHEV